MIVKSFTAESAAAALKLVREQMGGEAIVLKTVQRTDGPVEHQVEITACIERASVAQTDIILATETTPQRLTPGLLAGVTGPIAATDDHVGGRLAAMEQKLDQLVAEGSKRVNIEDHSYGSDLAGLEDCLKAADLPQEFTQSLIAKVKRTLETVGDFHHVVEGALRQALDQIVTPGIDIAPGARIAFVGPAGMGKSSIMGKLAARLIFEDQIAVRLANLNSIKLAAHEEVAGYAEALGAEFLPDMPASSDWTLDETTVTLFDCAALPNDTGRLDAMKSQLALVKPTHCIAVLSSLTRTSDTARLADNLAELNPTHLAVTMLDQSSCFGPAIAVAHRLSTKIALGSDAPGGMGRLQELESEILVKAILNCEVSNA